MLLHIWYEWSSEGQLMDLQLLSINFSTGYSKDHKSISCGSTTREYHHAWCLWIIKCENIFNIPSHFLNIRTERICHSVTQKTTNVRNDAEIRAPCKS